MTASDPTSIATAGQWHHHDRAPGEPDVWYQLTDEPDGSRAISKMLIASAPGATTITANTLRSIRPAKLIAEAHAGDRAAPTTTSLTTPLSTVAQVYKEQLERQAFRATTATAEILGVSRATATRRIQQCREQGFLPPRQEKKVDQK